MKLAGSRSPWQGAVREKDTVRLIRSAMGIAGAGMVETPKLVHVGMTAQLGWGFAASAVFGLLAIAGLLAFVRTKTYRPFAIYRIALAVLVVVIAVTVGG